MDCYGFNGFLGFSWSLQTFRISLISKTSWIPKVSWNWSILIIYYLSAIHIWKKGDTTLRDTLKGIKRSENADAFPTLRAANYFLHWPLPKWPSRLSFQRTKTAADNGQRKKWKIQRFFSSLKEGISTSYETIRAKTLNNFWNFWDFLDNGLWSQTVPLVQNKVKLG